MRVLFQVSGAITSYLIILIQFNLAGNKSKGGQGNSTMTTSNENATLSDLLH